ncbi:MAG TPA: serine protease [Planktothrix sp.]|jgi:hypothetical protein
MYIAPEMLDSGIAGVPIPNLEATTRGLAQSGYTTAANRELAASAPSAVPSAFPEATFGETPTAGAPQIVDISAITGQNLPSTSVTDSLATGDNNSAGAPVVANDANTAGQATVQIVTPIDTTNADGTVTPGHEYGTGSFVQAPDGSHVVLAPAHTVPDGTVTPTTDGTANITGPSSIYQNGQLLGTADVTARDDTTDLAGLTMTGPVLNPSAVISLNPDATPAVGETLSSIGYPGGQPNQATSTGAYDGTEAASESTPGANGNFVVTEGGAVGGQSGSPLFNSDYQSVGMVDRGSVDQTTSISAADEQQFLDNNYSGLFNSNWFTNYIDSPTDTTTAPAVTTETTPAPVDTTPPPTAITAVDPSSLTDATSSTGATATTGISFDPDIFSEYASLAADLPDDYADEFMGG